MEQPDAGCKTVIEKFEKYAQTCTYAIAVFTPDDEKSAEAFSEGDLLRLAEQPPQTHTTTMTTEEAWLLGFLVAEGSIQPNGKARITCNDDAGQGD